MPYLNLFRSGTLPSFTRLSITPGFPAAGHYWRLQWHCADRALVLPGELVCEFAAETGDEQVTVTAPVPGRLRITVPAGRYLEPDIAVGEIHYGAAFEAELRRDAIVAATAARRTDIAGLAAERQRLAAEIATGKREITTLRARLAALTGVDNTGARPEASVLAELLPRLLRALTNLAAEQRRSLTAQDRLRLVGLLVPVRQALVAVGKWKAPRRPKADAELLGAIAALERLYGVHIERARQNPGHFPDPIHSKKLAIWHDLRDEHSRQLWNEGLAAGEDEESRGTGK